MNRPIMMRLLSLLIVGNVACADSPAEPEVAQPDPPRVAVVEVTTLGDIPGDLKTSCTAGPDTFDGGSLCPVIQWDGLTYWAHSFGDNRSSMAIVAYDSAGAVAGRWDRQGARYVWRIDLDEVAKTVTFRGQADRTITASWAEIGIQG